MHRNTIAIIGSGSLGTIVGKGILERLPDHYQLLGIFSERIEDSLILAKQLDCKAYKSFNEIILDKPDYLIEAASPDSVKDIATKVLENGIDFIPLSVGALADPVLYKEIEQTALSNNSRVHIPSGAVGGFDVLHSSTLMEDVDVEITTEKPPKSLNGAPFLKNKTLSETKNQNIFKGTAKEAIKAFPENTNVTVATALATTGVDNTKVTINSNPNLQNNTHSIKLQGDNIKIGVQIDAKPSADNPKSSSLAAYSVITLLENLVAPITF